ncbi:hypothetical protein [Nodularia chucula]|uniref:hypothetical protein n=1 Tax=Nodularia chucula TaxID=3093667 RepID=UPI0039C7509D
MMTLQLVRIPIFHGLGGECISIHVLLMLSEENQTVQLTDDLTREELAKMTVLTESLIIRRCIFTPITLDTYPLNLWTRAKIQLFSEIPKDTFTHIDKWNLFTLPSQFNA